MALGSTGKPFRYSLFALNTPFLSFLLRLSLEFLEGYYETKVQNSFNETRVGL